MIEVKYGCEWDGWCPSSMSSPYEVSLWKYIRRGWPSLSQFILYEVGAGSKVQFWLDRWCGTSSLADCYLELFRICQNKEASVADFMNYTNRVLHWDIHFFRVVLDWELEALSSFMDTIYDTPVRGIEEDKRCWLPNKSKGFMVSAYYHLLTSHSDHFSPLERAFGSKRFLLEWLSLYGLLPWGKSLTIDN